MHVTASVLSCGLRRFRFSALGFRVQGLGLRAAVLLRFPYSTTARCFLLGVSREYGDTLCGDYTGIIFPYSLLTTSQRLVNSFCNLLFEDFNLRKEWDSILFKSASFRYAFSWVVAKKLQLV